jgi:CDP-diacylglycerol--serine O-phosphatidyltransferase
LRAESMKRRLSDRVSNGRRAFLRAKRRSVPVRILIPNMVTLLGLCVGLTSIRMAVEGRFEYALLAIAGAAIIDGLDGRMARLLKASSRFGAELDSLSDFVCFGVAPALVLYLWGFTEVASQGWIVVLIFAVATALRLARFNVALDDPAKPLWENGFFVGIPAPAGAILLMLPLYLEGLGLPKSWMPMPLVGLYAVMVAGLMASRARTFSGKMIGKRIGPELIAPVIALGVFLVATLVTYPYLSGTVGCLTYLALIPVSLRRHAALSRQFATAETQAITHNGRAPDPQTNKEPTPG